MSNGPKKNPTGMYVASTEQLPPAVEVHLTVAGVAAGADKF